MLNYKAYAQKRTEQNKKKTAALITRAQYRSGIDTSKKKNKCR